MSIKAKLFPVEGGHWRFSVKKHGQEVVGGAGFDSAAEAFDAMVAAVSEDRALHRLEAALRETPIERAA